MKKGKEDRRIQRTRHLLRQALFTLIVERGYETITVEEITERANIGRATFYVHYKDKEELLLVCLEEMFHEVAATLGPISEETFQAGGKPPAQLAFEHIAQHHQLYRVLFTERGAAVVSLRILALLATISRRYTVGQFDEARSPLPLDILAYHLAGSLFALLVWWLTNDMPYSPEHMANIFQHLAVPGLAHMVGLKPTFPELPRPEQCG